MRNENEIGPLRGLKYFYIGNEQMERLNIKEIQGICLGILNHVDAFCRANKIQYFLDSGTLIGAARNKGFVPWDDDIDIVMPRPDYARFLREFIDSEGYKLFAPSRGNSFLPYARVCEMSRTYLVSKSRWTQDKPGIGIDILPLDGAPDTIEEFDELSATYVRLRNRLWRYRSIISPRSFECRNTLEIAKTLAHTCRRCLFKRYFDSQIKTTLNNILALQEKYDYNKSCMCYYIGVNYGRRKYWCKEWFDAAIEMEFCGKCFSVPKGYAERLTAEYGDWRTPPAESERNNHANIQEVYWRRVGAHKCNKGR